MVSNARHHAASVVALDNEREAFPFEADPDAALRDRPEPVLLDEWQACPEVLGAVKRTVDTECRAGRFILTGSVRSDADPALWPGTGRLIRIAMHPLTVREQLSAPPRPFLSALLAAGPLTLPSDPPDLRGYAEIALRGGFPEPAVQLVGSVRAGWLDSCLDQLLTHERAAGRHGRDPAGRVLPGLCAELRRDRQRHDPLPSRRLGQAHLARIHETARRSRCRRRASGMEQQPPQASGPRAETVRRRHRPVGLGRRRRPERGHE